MAGEGNTGAKKVAERGLTGFVDAVNFLSGGLMFKGLGLFFGDLYKCTKCGYVRGIDRGGKETD